MAQFTTVRCIKSLQCCSCRARDPTQSSFIYTSAYYHSLCPISSDLLNNQSEMNLALPINFSYFTPEQEIILLFHILWKRYKITKILMGVDNHSNLLTCKSQSDHNHDHKHYWLVTAPTFLISIPRHL